jgi:hypothetical protein
MFSCLFVENLLSIFVFQYLYIIYIYSCRFFYDIRGNRGKQIMNYLFFGVRFIGSPLFFFVWFSLLEQFSHLNQLFIHLLRWIRLKKKLEDFLWVFVIFLCLHRQKGNIKFITNILLF